MFACVCVCLACSGGHACFCAVCSCVVCDVVPLVPVFLLYVMLSRVFALSGLVMCVFRRFRVRLGCARVFAPCLHARVFCAICFAALIVFVDDSLLACSCARFANFCATTA